MSLPVIGASCAAEFSGIVIARDEAITVGDSYAAEHCMATPCRLAVLNLYVRDCRRLIIRTAFSSIFQPSNGKVTRLTCCSAGLYCDWS